MPPKLKTKPKASTATRLTNALANYIERNPQFFNIATTFTAARFAQRFKRFQFLGNHTTVPGAASYVAMQAKINKFLAYRGLKLKSRNYYSEWYFESAISDVTSHLRKAVGHDKAAATLQAGIITYAGTISRFTPVERDLVSKHIYLNSVNGNRR